MMVMSSWTPHISRCENDGISLEWWVGPFKVALFVDTDGVDLLVSWGPDLVSEMVYVEVLTWSGLHKADV